MNGDLSNGAKTPGSPKRSSVKGRIQVALLDDTVVAFDVEPRGKGEELYKKVNKHLNLEEAEFFGLLFGDEEENICWLDHLKPINKQVKDPTKVVFKFRVMFYTPDPNSLQEYTRYLFTLQVRRDLLDGRLHCSEDTGALLASYIVQGELNDYDPMVHKDGYLTGFQFVPQQTPEIEKKIVEYHKSHKGETPSEADHNMLEIARQLEMYGVTLYVAQDSDNVPLHLAVYHLGVLVFQNRHKINNFSWANIRKISFKKKRLLIKLHHGLGDEEVVLFSMKSRNAAKTFWKVCVNHHVFFRQASASTLKRNKAAFRRGSKYRYSGRTKKEISEDASVTSYCASESDDKIRSQKKAVCTPSTSSVPDSPLSDLPPKYYSRHVSEDEGSFSVSSEAHPTLHRDESITELEDDNIVASPANHVSQNIITMTHQDTVEAFGQSSPTREPLPPSYTEVMNTEVVTYSVSEPLESAALEYDDEDFNSTLGHIKVEENDTLSYNFTLTPLSDNITVDDDDLSLDATVNVTSTDREIEDEVESMFKMINSGYNPKPTSWQYNISSVTGEELKSDDENNEHSDTEDKMNTEVSESTEVDADEARKFDTAIVNNNNTIQSDKTEADEETEAQLREKVKALYLQSCPSTQAYDSDSDASAITVDDEGSAFEDDISLTQSACSSLSSIHKREGYLRKFRATGIIYNIAKEILLTEKTYVKDLEVLTVSFRNLIEKDNLLPSHLMSLLFDNIDPLYDFHCSLLAELEERLGQWENVTTTESTRDCVQKIGDIMHRNMRQIKLYTSYIKKHGDVLLEIELEAQRSKKFEQGYKEFELGKVCYLPLNSFLLKPAQRLLYYRTMLGKLTKEYGNSHPDAIDAKVAYEEVTEACKQVENSVKNLENLHKMIEVQRDLVGIDDLVHPQRFFVREGCLYKVCRKGPQPRMFFLLSDLLLYTSQGVTSANQFRARAQIPLRSLKIEEGGVELHGLYTFTLIGPSAKAFVVAASSREEKAKWMSDLRKAIDDSIKKTVCDKCQSNRTEFMLYVGQQNKQMCKTCQNDMANLAAMPPDNRLQYWQQNYPQPPMIKRSFSDADSDDEGSYSLQEQYSSLDRRHAHVRTMSTRKVCWHRNASISMGEYALSLQNSISGTLLRRFKNTSKWQKLWVVFTNFSLYFFKTYEDEAPLASLPLIGYAISRPSDAEVHEEFAFKLQFKTHTYYFRAESEYSYGRWMDVLSIATMNSNRSRLESRSGV